MSSSHYKYSSEADDNDDYRVSNVPYLACGEDELTALNKPLPVSYLGTDGELYKLTIVLSAAVETHLVAHLTGTCPQHDSCESWYRLVHDLAELGGEAGTAIDTYLSTGESEGDGEWPWVKPMIEPGRCTIGEAEQVKEASQANATSELHGEDCKVHTSASSVFDTDSYLQNEEHEGGMRSTGAGGCDASGKEVVKRFTIRGCATADNEKSLTRADRQRKYRASRRARRAGQEQQEEGTNCETDN